MRYGIHKDEASKVWWAIVLRKGDVLFVLAEDEYEAVIKCFGTTDCYAVKHAIQSVVRCKSPEFCDFTFS